MNEINKTNLSEQTKYRPSEIIGTENYFNSEINQRKLFIKKLNVTIFDYIDKVLIVLKAKSSGVSTISLTMVVGPPAGIVSASFTLIFSLTTELIKKLLRTARKKKKKHDKILLVG